MKATVCEAEKNTEIEFPCLMMAQGDADVIVLASEFNDNDKYIVVLLTGHRQGDVEIYHSKKDLSYEYELYCGSVTLENDE
jgi:hypothetical protein